MSAGRLDAGVRRIIELFASGWEHIFASDSFDDDGTPDYVLATYDYWSIRAETLPDGRGGERKKTVGLAYEGVGPQRIRVKASASALARLRAGLRVLYRYTVSGHEAFNVSASRGITLRDCHFFGLGDDALNIHAKAGEIAGFGPASGALKVICRHRHVAGQVAQPGVDDIIDVLRGRRLRLCRPLFPRAGHIGHPRRPRLPPARYGRLRRTRPGVLMVKTSSAASRASVTSHIPNSSLTSEFLTF